MPQSETVKCNKKTDKTEAFYKMLSETKQALDGDYSVLSCDGDQWLSLCVLNLL